MWPTNILGDIDTKRCNEHFFDIKTHSESLLYKSPVTIGVIKNPNMGSKFVGGEN